MQKMGPHGSWLRTQSIGKQPPAPPFYIRRFESLAGMTTKGSAKRERSQVFRGLVGGAAAGDLAVLGGIKPEVVRAFAKFGEWIEVGASMFTTFGAGVNMLVRTTIILSRERRKEYGAICRWRTMVRDTP
jgi:hypothetical protein